MSTDDDIDAIIARHEQRLAEHRRDADEGFALASGPRKAATAAFTDNAFLPDDDDADVPRSSGRAAVAAKPMPWAKSTTYSNANATEVDTTRHSSPTRSAGGSSNLRRGEYVVESPTALYERTQRWAHNRDRALAQQQLERSRQDHVECSFQPRLVRANSGSSTPARRAKSRSATNDTTPDAASFHTHVQRHEGARRDRDEAIKRVAVDIAHWVPRTTKPKEFSFGQRSAHIPSLRKPVNRIDALNDAADPLLAPRDMPTARHRTRTPRSNDEKSIRLSDELPHQDAAQELQDANSRIAALSKELQTSRAKATEYEEHISALNGTIIGLRRELEVAKNKLRQLALSTHHVGSS